jgi:hypothetical protein
MVVTAARQVQPIYLEVAGAFLPLHLLLGRVAKVAPAAATRRKGAKVLVDRTPASATDAFGK